MQVPAPARTPCTSLMVINEPFRVYWGLIETGCAQKSVPVKNILMKEMWFHWDLQLPHVCKSALLNVV